jgi:tetratricopeptide (TPR) repeat protein
MFDWRNHYREFIGVALLIGLGIVGWFARGLFTGPEVSAQAAAFSSERTEADKAYIRQDWSGAEEHYRAMTERDPYNGYAWYSLGDSIWRQGRRLLNDRDRTSRAIVPDPARIDELNGEIRKLGEKAIACFSRAQDTGRFRILAGQRIAEIYTAIGEKRLAVEMLTKCFDDGMMIRGLRNIAEFVPLRGDPEFEELASRDPRPPIRGAGPPPVPAMGGGADR